MILAKIYNKFLYRQINNKHTWSITLIIVNTGYLLDMLQVRRCTSFTCTIAKQVIRTSYTHSPAVLTMSTSSFHVSTCLHGIPVLLHLDSFSLPSPPLIPRHSTAIVFIGLTAYSLLLAVHMAMFSLCVATHHCVIINRSKQIICRHFYYEQCFYEHSKTIHSIANRKILNN